MKNLYDVDPGEVVSLGGYELICVDVSGSRIARVRIVERPEEGEQRDVHYASAAMLKKVGERWQMLATNIVYLD